MSRGYVSSMHLTHFKKNATFKHSARLKSVNVTMDHLSTEANGFYGPVPKIKLVFYVSGIL